MTQFGVPVELVSSASEFLLDSQGLRSDDPFRTNILGSVATSVASGMSTYESYRWWILRDEDGNVVGAAMRTAPHGMVLSPMPPTALYELAQAICVHDDELPSVNGPADAVDTFVLEYAKTGSPGSMRTAHLDEETLLYSLKELKSSAVEGSYVRASKEDFEFALDWYLKFRDEAKIMLPNPSESVRSILKNDALRFWVIGGEKVSMAGHAPLVETPSGAVGRIGPVYTPPAHRRKGYAGALTAVLSQELLDTDAKVILFTDASNPTSNRVYQNIGFELIDRNHRVAFEVQSV